VKECTWQYGRESVTPLPSLALYSVMVLERVTQRVNNLCHLLSVHCHHLSTAADKYVNSYET